MREDGQDGSNVGAGLELPESALAFGVRANAEVRGEGTEDDEGARRVSSGMERSRATLQRYLIQKKGAVGCGASITNPVRAQGAWEGNENLGSGYM